MERPWARPRRRWEDSIIVVPKKGKCEAVEMLQSHQVRASGGQKRAHNSATSNCIEGADFLDQQKYHFRRFLLYAVSYFH
jgi:hypothetical protein